MVVLHKAERLDNKEKLIGYIVRLKGQYYIADKDNEFISYPVNENSIEPVAENLENLNTKLLRSKNGRVKTKKSMISSIRKFISEFISK